MFEQPSREYLGYIFDCDGTLADSMPLHHRAWRAALAAHGARFDFDWDLFLTRAGMTGEQTVRELCAQFSCAMDPESVAARQRAEFRSLVEGVKPIEQVVEFARSQAIVGRRVSVASGGDRSTVERTLRLIGVDELFSVVVVSADVPRGKPHPDLFLLAAERMQVSPADCLVFEDSLLGIEAAGRAGMGSVLVTRPRAGD